VPINDAGNKVMKSHVSMEEIHLQMQSDSLSAVKLYRKTTNNSCECAFCRNANPINPQFARGVLAADHDMLRSSSSLRLNLENYVNMLNGLFEMKKSAVQHFRRSIL